MMTVASPPRPTPSDRGSRIFEPSYSMYGPDTSVSAYVVVMADDSGRASATKLLAWPQYPCVGRW
jgi:hypothetical protein